MCNVRLPLKYEIKEYIFFIDFPISSRPNEGLQFLNKLPPTK